MITYQRVVIIIVRHFYTTTCKNTLQHSPSHPIPAQHVCECPTIKLQSYRQPTGHQVLHHRRRRRFLFFFSWRGIRCVNCRRRSVREHVLWRRLANACDTTMEQTDRRTNIAICCRECCTTGRADCFDIIRLLSGKHRHDCRINHDRADASSIETDHRACTPLAYQR